VVRGLSHPASVHTTNYGARAEKARLNDTLDSAVETHDFDLSGLMDQKQIDRNFAEQTQAAVAEHCSVEVVVDNPRMRKEEQNQQRIGFLLATAEKGAGEAEARLVDFVDQTVPSTHDWEVQQTSGHC
jgi:hypothetical protein